ncbi:hypothetical protein LJC72_02765 [Bacteroides sp. OttesenSCG-928-D19]|nr:hypothetical protein [Bacteroides sp. OttesenSCG-928-D19]
MKSIVSWSVIAIVFCLMFSIANSGATNGSAADAHEEVHASLGQLCCFDSPQQDIMRLTCDLPINFCITKALDDKKTRNLFYTFYSSYSAETKTVVARQYSVRRTCNYIPFISQSQMLSELRRLNI